MYTKDQYKLLKEKYGAYSSWAIWNERDAKDSTIIDSNIGDLHTKYVFVGLNISRPLLDSCWSNFHGGRNDRKLMYACNDTKLRGSYLTDLFKGIPEPSSAKLYRYIKQNPDVIDENVRFFKQEMLDIGINRDTIFVVLGKGVLPFYVNFFGSEFTNEYICYPHYASYGTDKDWVEGLWKAVGIQKTFLKDLPLSV